MKKHLFPMFLFLLAVMLVLTYCICHAAGWREHTVILSGVASVTSGAQGMAYILVYLSAMLVTPVLALTGALLAAHSMLVKALLARKQLTRD